jgi:hypothetical protein
MKRFALASVLAVVSCSGTSTPHRLSPIEVTDGESFLDAQNAEVCAWAIRCQLWLADREQDCRDSGMLGMGIAPAVRLSARDGSLRFDKDQALACIAAIRAGSCVTFPEGAEACTLALQPARNAGEVCHTSLDCFSQTCDGDGCNGTCLPTSKAGEPCGAHVAWCGGADVAGCCQPGEAAGTCMGFAAIGAACGEYDPCMFCDPGLAKCSNGICVALEAQGESCGLKDSVGCQPGLYCIWEKDLSTCQKTFAEGASCNPSEQMGQCSADLLCSYETGNCEKRDRMVGESCSIVGQDCLNSVCSAGICATPPQIGDDCDAARPCGSWSSCSGEAGKCVAPGDLGDSCAGGSQRLCKGPLRCLNGVCADYPKEGEACPYGSDVFPLCTYGLACTPRGVCVKPQAEGASCNSGAECASGKCENAACNAVCGS